MRVTLAVILIIMLGSVKLIDTKSNGGFSGARTEGGKYET